MGSYNVLERYLNMHCNVQTQILLFLCECAITALYLTYFVRNFLHLFFITAYGRLFYIRPGLQTPNKCPLAAYWRLKIGFV